MGKTQKLKIGLAVGALGIVFGDIGTSPLYAIQVAFGGQDRYVSISALSVYGIISLVFWTITLVVAVKYIGFVMRADNHGEGGNMALIARLRSKALTVPHRGMLIGLGLVGVALFYGDSAITPAISVLSAVEGLKVAAPNLARFIVPATVVILASLFWLQRYGTGVIGRLFGPIMLLWFTAIGVAGGHQVLLHPAALQALLPTTALRFVARTPAEAFVAMSTVVLAITGVEALYADMGHFGRAPISRVWFGLVFPALTLCYMGQGALILSNPNSVMNPFYLLFPTYLQLPALLLATAATLIASQSVISGAFSLTRQALQLNFLPRMTVMQTSAVEIGQIYMPFVNFVLFLVVLLFVMMFGSSVRLAGAYGVAVSGTLAIDTILFLSVMRYAWQKRRSTVALAGLVFLGVDAALVGATLPKILHGGWLPLTIALLVWLVCDTWSRGQAIVAGERQSLEGSLHSFTFKLHKHKPVRVPGQAVYIGHHPGYTPLALHTTVDTLHELHEKVVIVYVKVKHAAHVPEKERAVFDDLGYLDGISQVTLSYGFHDHINVPKTLRGLRTLSSELDFDPYKASYFVSLTRAVPGRRHNLARWRKSLYCLLDRNRLGSSDYYHLPIEHTSEMRTLITL